MDRRSDYHPAAAPPPPSAVDSRPPPQHHQQPPLLPPSDLAHHQHYPPPHQQHPPPPAYSGAPGPATLPPLQQTYGLPDQHKLPRFQHPPPPSHDPREGDYQYNSHPHSGHVTPAPVNRSYSLDSTHQRTPTTPAHPGPYPPGSSDSIPHQMEHAPHHGYASTNGLPHGLPPNQGPHHEHPPPYMTPMMDNAPHVYAPSQHMYSQPSYGPASAAVMGAQKRKQMRATQACDQCRTRKQKCDEGSPCSFCKENVLTCQYRDTPPAKTDKNMEKMLSYMEAQTEALSSQTEALSSQTEALSSLQRAMKDVKDHLYDTNTRLHHLESREPMPFNVNSRARLELPAPVDKDRSIEKKKPDLGDHRTAPHKLLMLWPTVQALLHASNDHSSESYVMSAEDRGSLRLYGRGECPPDDPDGAPPAGPVSPARSEESGDAPTPPEGLWGVGFPPTPSNSIPRRSEVASVGGLKPDNSLDLDVNTVTTLHDRYIRHFHIMHPILDKSKLRRMIESFIKHHSPGPIKHRQPFAVQSNGDSERPLKRQRSNGPTDSPATYLQHHSNVPERSPTNALIYFVLALGKMAAYKKALPGPASELNLNANTMLPPAESPLSAAGFKTSPGSADITPGMQPASSHMDQSRSRSRRSSMEGGPAVGPRNMDVIPGLAYFAKGSELLADFMDGHDLIHAQLFLLAGLYKGQLARVNESLNWFTRAGRILQMLLDREKLFNHNYWTGEGAIGIRLERGQAVIRNMRMNLIVVASWSCLQLESDILAEVQLPSSNLPKYEDTLLFPRQMPEDESYGGLDPSVHYEDGTNIPTDDVTNLFYMGQLYLRRRLNQVHRQLYGSECHDKSLEEVREVLITHELNLQEWRANVPSNTSWSDDDDPPADILQARLRAKYWGARYIINRPFLDYFLHIMPHVKEGMKVQDSARDNNGQSRHVDEIHIFKAIAGMKESAIMAACVRCVHAAMASTIAFDNVPDRLIVTNIHGTAHAQFGNMLVLSATYFRLQAMPDAPELVSGGTLQRLLERTIKFLRRLSPISPTCRHDCHILEKIRNRIFPSARDPVYRNQGVEAGLGSAASSFSHST